MPTLLKDTFKAWLNVLPASTHKVIVTGGFEVPTSGWTAELVSNKPGPGPLLTLDVKAQAPTGTVDQLVHKIALHYEQDESADTYEQVTVQYEGDSVTLDVTKIHLTGH